MQLLLVLMICLLQWGITAKFDDIKFIDAINEIDLIINKSKVLQDTMLFNLTNLYLIGK